MKTDLEIACVRRRPLDATRHVPIESSLDGPLEADVSRGFTAITIERFYDGGLCAVVFWRDDESGLEISARQVDAVANVTADCGVLCVGPALAARPANAERLPIDFHDRVHATTLLRLHGGRTIACGLALTGRAGSRIVLLAGPWPYALEIDAAFATDAAPNVVAPTGAVVGRIASRWRS